jgi:hypothetical protein
LFLEMPEANLAAGMKWLRGACRFDYRHQACGPLCQGPKPAREKMALGWRLRERARVSLRRASRRLETGHESRVSQTVSRPARRPGRKLEKWKGKLMELSRKMVCNMKTVIILGLRTPP